MIPYIEIVDKYTLKKVALIEPSECWFELSYYDVGEFEIYCRASNYNIEALQKGRYVTIPNKNYVWVITKLKYTFNAEGTRMISASGKEAKWLLSKRVIQKPLDLSTYTLSAAIYKLFNDNIGNSAGIARKINKFETRLINIDTQLQDQATRSNLLEFTNNLLKTYSCGSTVTLENETLYFEIIQGRNLSNNVKFSQSLDNLLASTYETSDEEIATNALVVSTIEDIDYTQTYDKGSVGIDRSEILVNSNLSIKYEDANGVEQETTPTSDLFKNWQLEEGKNELTKHYVINNVDGEIDILNSNYVYNVDFKIGDKVRVQDEYFNYYFDTRIKKYTFKQDAKGYGEEAEYGG